MSYTVNSFEEMPNALSYLIKTVEELKSTVKALQHKQASDSPKWMDMMSFVPICLRIRPGRRFMDGCRPNRYPYIR